MNLLRSALATLILLVTVQATGVAPGQIKNFVTFGDSYTDIVSVGDGGTAWPVRLIFLVCLNEHSNKLPGIRLGLREYFSFSIRKVRCNLFEQFDGPTLSFGVRKPAADIL